MKVKLLQAASQLTVGHVYEVVQEDDRHFMVMNDCGYLQRVFQSFFEEYQEQGFVKEVKSDGTSSSYYDLTITRKDGSTVEVTVQDIIPSVLKNHWHFGNIFKAMVRIVGKMNGGGKVGTDEHYDANKVVWFAEDFKSRLPK